MGILQIHYIFRQIELQYLDGNCPEKISNKNPFHDAVAADFNLPQFDVYFRSVNDMREPAFSPWGEVQSCETLYTGMFLVTTPGHGGIMVESQAVFYLSAAARKCGFREGGYLCFEEDSQENVVLRELLDKKLWKIPERISDPAAFEQAINESLQRWNPEYWNARKSGKTMPRCVSHSRTKNRTVR